MTSFLLYIVRAGLYLGLFYAFYLLVMRRTTFFRLNRVLLLCGSFLCLMLPFFRLRSVVTAGVASELSMVAAGRNRLFRPPSPGRKSCWPSTWPERSPR